MRRIRRCLVLACLIGLAAGCASSPRGFPGREGIANFDRVNARLYRGAQPTALGIQALADLGVKTIVNLRMAGDVWPAEEQEARRAGLLYTNVPMSGSRRPTEAQVARVLALLDTAPAPVFVHCRLGCDRTGTIIACYRIREAHWTSEAALREARQYGMAAWNPGMKSFVRDYEKRLRRDRPPGRRTD